MKNGRSIITKNNKGNLIKIKEWKRDAAKESSSQKEIWNEIEAMDKNLVAQGFMMATGLTKARPWVKEDKEAMEAYIRYADLWNRYYVAIGMKTT